jgi:hypothetical protein
MISSPPEKVFKFPVLEPTVFFLQNFNAKDWIRVTRKKNLQKARRMHNTSMASLVRRRSPLAADRCSLMSGVSGLDFFKINGPSTHKANGCANVHVGQKGWVYSPRSRENEKKIRLILKSLEKDQSS